MRAASRLFASIKPGQFLEAGTPTGLTGLLTHNSPRSTLLYLYNSTLDKLQHIPESSVYRQSTEALTKHRLKIIEAAKPPGWDEWAEKIAQQIGDDPKGFATTMTKGGVLVDVPQREDMDSKLKASEWDGEKVGRAFPEGIRTLQERRPFMAQLKGPKDYDPERAHAELKLEPEPQLTAEVISEVENQIGAGLIEEVIQVAEGEHTLVDEMVKARVWEDLIESAPEGQWSYSERGHTST